MLEKIVDSIKSNYIENKEELKAIKEGYDFAKYLVKDVKARSQLVLQNSGNELNILALVLQLGEYQLAHEDVQMEYYDPHSLGVVFYGLTHKKDHIFLDDFWKSITNKSSSDVLPE